MQDIIVHLSKDPKLKKIIAEVGELKFNTDRGELYYALMRSIVGQQLSVKAATTIHGRFINLFPDASPHPDDVLALDTATLRSVGLSRQKANYIQNVARFFKENDLENKDWSLLTEEEIIQYLTQIKGVGKWTVEMILMFALHRDDVMPTGDLGIQQGMAKLYGLTETKRALEKRMLEIAEPWRPYRTWACCYVWQWKDA